MVVSAMASTTLAFGYVVSCSAAFFVPFALVGVVCASAFFLDDTLALLWLGSLVNVVLSMLKAVLAHVTPHGKALMADAVHGLGDTVAEVITAFAYIEASKPPDREHPWGHGKIESIGALVVAGVLLYVAATLAWDSITSIAQLLRRTEGEDAEGDATACWGSNVTLPYLGNARRAALAVTVASLFLKESLFRATLIVGERGNSQLAVATAWHHRSDALAAGVTLASQLGTSFGQHYLDSVGGGIVAAMLAHSASESLFESLNDLLDYNAASEEGDGAWEHCGSKALGASIMAVHRVQNHSLRARRMGPFCLVDVTIVVGARLSASAASVVAEAVHNRVMKDFHPYVTDVLVHVDPDGSPQSHKLETGEERSEIFSVDSVEVETIVREAIFSVKSLYPRLPAILEITDLQTYYTSVKAEDGSEASPAISVKADILMPQGILLRSATAVARAARLQVLGTLPGVVDVDIDLELDETGDDVGYQEEVDAEEDPCARCVCAEPSSWPLLPLPGELTEELRRVALSSRFALHHNSLDHHV